MKKKIISGIAVLAIATIAAWNVSFNSQKNGLPDIALANLEALAQEACNYTVGYTMGNKMVWEGIDINLGYPTIISITGRFTVIQCCQSSVQANACNFSAQDARC